MGNFTKIKECPKCGEREIGIGHQRGYSDITPKGKVLGSAIEYIVCTECGYIIEGYVKKPNRFKGTL
ncbi:MULTISPECIES: Lar family restriction alleviation protein [Virgibacillus]|uniref:Transcription initiation factor TFIIIB n=3 Tax=Virgibacillus TaxID=84406 RepID=A0A024QBF4_9BACI|nr:MULTISPECIES: Lar family restriction alleviation protein [Virgibacillus]EQB36176.1 hypothetical protein M948_14165 [Virgibacillus sp. CM-4]MYL42045.1 transcription initiation factor TFIIIB [Virgibacillus massiliensis]GGJ46069.1 hypothetical protein GCM10007111_05040 [Virgibacillus kapii]CDQ39873.1 hypothetical protein BN990_02190 [Virgibacillus massiliensis]